MSRSCYRYQAVGGAPDKSMCLVADEGTPAEVSFPLANEIEIGRDQPGRDAAGVLLIDDPTVSYRHCVLALLPDGRCTVRDLSRNGTRIDGRRLLPNIEVDIHPGQVLELGSAHRFVLAGKAPVADPENAEGRTVSATGTVIATVLVGDVRDYTVLVRKGPQAEVQRCVNRVFDVLAAAVARLGGTMKEHQGDAIFAFWEGDLRGSQAVAACAAALDLDRIAVELGSDSDVWSLRGLFLRMDWALATGPVRIDTLGGAHPTGLSMIGDAVPLAFRLEKFADEQTGRILACPVTCAMAKRKFVFRDLGERTPKGFDRPCRVFALESALGGGVT